MIAEGQDLGLAHVLQLAAVHRGGPRDAQGVPGEVRRGGQVRRGDQRQRRVLRQGPPAVRARRLGRARHPRGDRLDGRTHDPARLRAEVRPGGDHHRTAEPDRSAAHAALRPRPRLLDALAVGLRRDRLPQGQGQARAQERRRPVRPGLQGQGHDAHRDARHGRSRRRGMGYDPETASRTSSWRRSRRSARPPSPGRSAASPATSTPRTSPRATPG